MSELRPGLRARREHVVTADDTAAALGSGDVSVLATPRMLAWIEAATVDAVAGALPAGRTSVGARVEIDHLAPTPVGVTVTVRAELLAVDGRALTFDVAVDDDRGPVGAGRVVRSVVDHERFLTRAAQRRL